MSSDNNILNASAKVLAILDGKYFTVVSNENDGKNVSAICVICNHSFKGSLRVTSNFVLHFKRNHEEILNKYKEYKRQKQSDLSMERWQNSALEITSEEVLAMQEIVRSRAG